LSGKGAHPREISKVITTALRLYVTYTEGFISLGEARKNAHPSTQSTFTARRTALERFHIDRFVPTGAKRFVT
jgi:hypothetical protein